MNGFNKSIELVTEEFTEKVVKASGRRNDQHAFEKLKNALTPVLAGVSERIWYLLC